MKTKINPVVFHFGTCDCWQKELHKLTSFLLDEIAKKTKDKDLEIMDLKLQLEKKKGVTK